MGKDDLQYLLNDIYLVSRNYRDRKTPKFNVFTVIRKGHEEVGLHSNFLFELLSPDGSHGKKDIFLKLFIKALKVDIEIDRTQVFCEKENIDLLIRNRSQAIIIENKIYAGDQSEQLSRYYHLIKEKGIKDIHILYLSLDGKPPNQNSIGELPIEIIKSRLYNKSYHRFIIPWLSLCLKECPTEPHLRETIVQYQQLLKDLTMSDEIKERIELLDLLGKNNNMLQAEYIVRNWSHMKWHTEMNFWNELMSDKPSYLDKYSIVEEYLYSKDMLNGTIHKSRNRDFEYGIALKLFDFEGEEVCFMVERGVDYLDYGLIINYLKKDKKTWNIKKTDFLEYLVKNVSEDHLGEQKSPWIHWKYPKQEINFESFDNSTTLSLANPDERKKIITNLWSEMTLYINKVVKWQESN